MPENGDSLARWVLSAMVVLVTLTQGVVPATAAPPLLRTVKVVGAAVSVAFSAPTRQLVVTSLDLPRPIPGGMDEARSPIAYTVLDGKTGSVVRRIQATGPEMYPLHLAADGSGNVYLVTPRGLQALGQHGTLGPVIAPAGQLPNLGAGGSFFGPAAVDQRRSLLLVWVPSAFELAGVDLHSMQQRFTWLSALKLAQPSVAADALVVDTVHGRIYIASDRTLTELDEETGTVAASVQSGFIWGAQALARAHLIVTYGLAVATDPSPWAGTYTGQDLPGPGPAPLVARMTIVSTQPLRILHTLDLAAPSNPEQADPVLCAWVNPMCGVQLGAMLPEYCGGGNCPPQPLAVDTATGHVLLLQQQGIQQSVVWIVDIASGTVVQSVQVDAEANGVVVDASLHRAFVTSMSVYGVGSVTVLDTRTGAVVAHVTGIPVPTGLAVDPFDGTVAVVPANTGTVVLFPANITGTHAYAAH